MQQAVRQVHNLLHGGYITARIILFPEQNPIISMRSQLLKMRGSRKTVRKPKSNPLRIRWIPHRKRLMILIKRV